MKVPVNVRLLQGEENREGDLKPAEAMTAQLGHADTSELQEVVDSFRKWGVTGIYTLSSANDADIPQTFYIGGGQEDTRLIAKDLDLDASYEYDLDEDKVTFMISIHGE